MFLLYLVRNPTSPPVPAPGGKGDLNWDRFDKQSYNYMYFNNGGPEIRKERLSKNNAFWLEYATWALYDRVRPQSGQ